MTLTTVELRPPKGSIKNGKWTATREIWLPKASEFNAFVEELLGVSFEAGEGVVQGASQTYPGKPWLILVDASYEEMGDEATGGTDYFGDAIAAKDDDGVAQPRNGYKFTLVYETPTFDQGTAADPNNQDLPPLPANTFLTVKYDLGMQVLATAKDAYEWKNDNDVPSKALGVRTEVSAFQPIATLTLTWHRVPRPPWTNIKALRGKINNEPFLNHPSETVLFVGLVGQREFQVGGKRQWQLDYKFSIKEVPYVHPVDGASIAGWRQFLRRDPGILGAPWEYIQHKVSGEFLYQVGDFNLLFKSEST